jgi:hypothetical protein
MAKFEETGTDKGFVLGEDHLREIDKKLRKNNGTGELRYLVYLASSQVISKNTIHDLLEEVSEGDQMERVVIAFKPTDEGQPTVDLFFSNRWSSLQVTGESDDVPIVHNNLDKYLGRKVYTVRYSWRKNIRSILLTLSLVIGVAGFTWFEWRHANATVLRADQVVSSQNVNEKLDYLVMQFDLSTKRVGRFILAISPFFLLLFLLRIRAIDEYISAKCARQFPEYVFLFGDEKEQHKKRQRRNKFVVGSVLVATILELARNGLVLWVFSR